MSKKSRNLSLDPEVIDRAERYSELHGTNVSQLVSDLLASLPLPEDLGAEDLTPTVSRLFGIIKGSKDPLGDYHRHLARKYGA